MIHHDRMHRMYQLTNSTEVFPRILVIMIHVVSMYVNSQNNSPGDAKRISISVISIFCSCMFSFCKHGQERSPVLWWVRTGKGLLAGPRFTEWWDRNVSSHINEANTCVATGCSELWLWAHSVLSQWAHLTLNEPVHGELFFLVCILFYWTQDERLPMKKPKLLQINLGFTNKL